MEKKTPSKNPRKTDTRLAKQLVFLLSVCSTLGFWAIFSHKIDLNQPDGSGAGSGAGELTPAGFENQLVLDLPPMPTLIPSLNSARTNLSLAPDPSPEVVNLAPPAVPLAGKIFLGGSQPQSNVVVVRKTVTKTRSSK